MNTIKPEDIREWRKRNKISMRLLAKILGVNPLTVFRWEHGLQRPKPYLLMALKAIEKLGVHNSQNYYE